MLENAVELYASNKISIDIKRSGENLNFKIKPKIIKDKNIFGETINRHIIGITASGASIHEEISIIKSWQISTSYTYEMSKLTFLSIIKLFQGKLDTKNIGGPIMIAKIAGEKAKKGFSELLFFISILSINLGVLNLLPIPVLDGGHLIFFSIEGIFRKPINLRAQEIINQIGIFFLLIFMVYVVYNDILKMINM